MAAKKYKFTFTFIYGMQNQASGYNLETVNILEALRKINLLFFRLKIINCFVLIEGKNIPLNYLKDKTLSDANGFKEKELKELIFKNTIIKTKKK